MGTTKNQDTMDSQTARTIIFRAMLGDQPLPTPAAIEQARATLHADAVAQATLDELVDVVTRIPTLVDDALRDRLQGYIAAQLAGQEVAVAFADIRRALDRNVVLAEEYALLYETMQAEMQASLPIPTHISAPNLAFLPKQQPSQPLPIHATRWWLQWWHSLREWPHLHKPLFPRLQPSLLQPIIALLLFVTLTVGSWVASPRLIRVWQATPTPTATQSSQGAFLKKQLELDAQLPLSVNTHLAPEQPITPVCLTARMGAFDRRICSI